MSVFRRDDTVNILQLSELMKNQPENLYPFVQEIYNKKTGNIPANKVINLAKALKNQPNKNIRNTMIEIYERKRGNIPTNALAMMANSVNKMRKPILENMRRSRNINSTQAFINIVKKHSEEKTNDGKITARSWSAFSPLWFSVHPNSKITYSDVVTSNQVNLVKSPKGSGDPSAATATVLGLGVVGIVLAFFLSGNI